MALTQNSHKILLEEDGAGERDTNFHPPRQRDTFPLWGRIKHFETCVSSLEFLQGNFTSSSKVKATYLLWFPVADSEADADRQVPGSS